MNWQLHRQGPPLGLPRLTNPEPIPGRTASRLLTHSHGVAALCLALLPRLHLQYFMPRLLEDPTFHSVMLVVSFPASHFLAVANGKYHALWVNAPQKPREMSGCENAEPFNFSSRALGTRHHLRSPRDLRSACTSRELAFPSREPVS
jgi:hypothetical protein